MMPGITTALNLQNTDILIFSFCFLGGLGIIMVIEIINTELPHINDPGSDTGPTVELCCG